MPGGFGDRGTRGMMAAAQYAREHRSRISASATGSSGRRSSTRETSPACPTPIPPSARPTRRPRSSTSCATCSAWTTWAARCGSAATRANSRPARSHARSTASTVIQERHRHRYEFNCLYEKALTDKRHAHLGPVARRQVRRDRRSARASLVRRRAVPSGVQVEADEAASAVRVVRRSELQAQGRRSASATPPRRWPEP